MPEPQQQQQMPVDPIVAALTFQPSQDAITLAQNLSKLLQQYEQGVAGKTMVPAKQVSDFTLMAHKLLAQYILQAQTDMAQHTTQVGAFLLQHLEQPEPILQLAIPPDISREIQETLDYFADFCAVTDKTTIPLLRKALEVDVDDTTRADARKAIDEMEEATRDAAQDCRTLIALVDSTTFEDGEEEEEPAEVYEEESADDYEDLVG